jgi:hypothetical protein
MRRLFVLTATLTLLAPLSNLSRTFGQSPPAGWAAAAAATGNYSGHVRRQESGGWVKFSSEAGHFSILMPVKPTESKQDVATKLGPMVNNVFMAVTPAGHAYALSYADYPANNVDPQETLDKVRDGAVNGIKGQLVKSTNITHKSYPGREFQATVGDGLYTSRVYLVGTRLYQMVAMGPKDRISAADINRFLTSFELKTATGK